jgi:preprotein translocase subunit SecD
MGIRIHLNAEDAKFLQNMTAKNLGRTLILMQGERVLASPTIRAAIQGQDFVVTLKK